jgi:hypothetical protein
MNRVSVRGFGMAAAIVAAGSLAVGAAASAVHPRLASAASTDPSVVSASGATTSEVFLLDDVRTERALLAQRRLDNAQGQRVAARVAAARAAAAHAAAVKAAQVKAAQQKAAAKQAAQRAAAAKRAAAAEKASRTTTRPVAKGTARAIGAQMVAARGWSSAQFVCLDKMWTRESNWRTTAYNPNGGAYGIPQAQPGSKLASAGADWRTSAATQIKWGLSYIARTYGTPCQAWAFWQSHHWY